MPGYVFQFGLVFQELPTLLDGALTTLHLSLLTLLGSLVVGTFGAMGRLSRFAWLRRLATGYVEVVRNTPLLVQLFFIYFGLGQLAIDVPNYLAALIGLVLNNGAYLTEIVRAGIEAIPRAQHDAGRSLGMSYLQLMRHVVFPQAFRVIYPPLCNQFIGIILFSSLVSVIAVEDLALKGKMLISRTFRSFETYLVVTAMYVVMTLAISAALKLIGRRVFRHA
ncbi:MAG TPA: amino acid ABC transporter permease [Methylomirabilota bacterium]|nr:amino acid ABC transporter permease [Methylomirabilota bacterium]